MQKGFLNCTHTALSPNSMVLRLLFEAVLHTGYIDSGPLGNLDVLVDRVLELYVLPSKLRLEETRMQNLVDRSLYSRWWSSMSIGVTR